MVNRGAEINLENNEGKTAIINACYPVKEEFIYFLYENGADFFIKNKHGETAYSILKDRKNITDKLESFLEKLLLEHLFVFQDDSYHGL